MKQQMQQPYRLTHASQCSQQHQHQQQQRGGGVAYQQNCKDFLPNDDPSEPLFNLSDIDCYQPQQHQIQRDKSDRASMCPVAAQGHPCQACDQFGNPIEIPCPDCNQPIPQTSYQEQKTRNQTSILFNDCCTEQQQNQCQADHMMSGDWEVERSKQMRSNGQRKQKKKTVVTSLQITMVAMVTLIILTTLTAFSDLLRLASTSQQETLRYLTHICVLVPLVVAFACQPKLIAKILNDKRLQRSSIADHLPKVVNQKANRASENLGHSNLLQLLKTPQEGHDNVGEHLILEQIRELQLTCTGDQIQLKSNPGITKHYRTQNGPNYNNCSVCKPFYAIDKDSTEADTPSNQKISIQQGIQSHPSQFQNQKFGSKNPVTFKFPPTAFDDANFFAPDDVNSTVDPCSESNRTSTLSQEDTHPMSNQAQFINKNYKEQCPFKQAQNYEDLQEQKEMFYWKQKFAQSPKYGSGYVSRTQNQNRVNIPVPRNCIEEVQVLDSAAILNFIRNLMTPLEYLLLAMNMTFLVAYNWKVPSTSIRQVHVPYANMHGNEGYRFEEKAQILVGIDEEHAAALSLMATIDQLILFFFALKVCLTFSQLVTKDLMNAKLVNNSSSYTSSQQDQNNLNQTPADDEATKNAYARQNQFGTRQSQSQQSANQYVMNGNGKVGQKYNQQRRGQKNGLNNNYQTQNLSHDFNMPSTLGKPTNEEKRLIQDHLFYETIKKARQSKREALAQQNGSIAGSISSLRDFSEIMLKISLFAANLIAIMYALLALDSPSP